MAKRGMKMEGLMTRQQIAQAFDRKSGELQIVDNDLVLLAERNAAAVEGMRAASSLGMRTMPLASP